MRLRSFYALIAVVAVLAAMLFVYSFFYIDSVKHRTIHFTVERGGAIIGSIRLDRFTTDESIIYRSSYETPEEPVYQEAKAELAVSHRYELKRYERTLVAGKATETLVLEAHDQTYDFLSTRSSDYSVLMGAPLRKGVFVFDENQPLTYLPLIENYDFSKGGSQAFYAITPYAHARPPVVHLVTFTSIRDERIALTSTHRIKCECIVWRTSEGAQGMLWVSKSGRSLMMIDIPSKGVRVKRRLRPAEAPASPKTPRASAGQEIPIPSGKITLSGSLSIPAAKAPVPACILLAPDGPFDRHLAGIFDRVIPDLNDIGVAALSFDRRGIGLSQGDADAADLASSLGDDIAAYDALVAHPGIDRQKIFILSYADAATRAAALAAARPSIAGIVLISPYRGFADLPGLSIFGADERIAPRPQDGPSGRAKDLARQTSALAADTAGSWANKLGKKIFLEKRREELARRNELDMSSVTAAVLVVKSQSEDKLPAGNIFSLVLPKSARAESRITQSSGDPFFIAEAGEDAQGRTFALDASAQKYVLEWIASIISAPSAPAPSI